MSVGFGFSAGDFIAALNLVRDVVDALQASSTARTEYRELLRQLYSLEAALQQVNRLELDDTDDGGSSLGRNSEIVALRQTAAQCQRTIDDFFVRIKSYQPYLTADGSMQKPTSRWKARWKKVQWTLCRKDDVAKLQADLIGHTESINLLLTTLQMYGSLQGSIDCNSGY